MGLGEECLEILRVELRKNGMQLEKERTAGGEEKRETTRSVDAATPDVWMCETGGNAGQLPGVGGEKWNSVFLFSICSLFVF